MDGLGDDERNGGNGPDDAVDDTDAELFDEYVDNDSESYGGGDGGGDGGDGGGDDGGGGDGGGDGGGGDGDGGDGSLTLTHSPLKVVCLWFCSA